MKTKIIRVEKSTDGVFGVMLINGESFCVTLEPEDHANAVMISCIPPGAYICERVDSPKYGDTFEVKDVPNRTHILIHSGNVEDHTHGCVLLAQYFGKLKEQRAVLNSGSTFKEFMNTMKGVDRFLLEIEDATV